MKQEDLKHLAHTGLWGKYHVLANLHGGATAGGGGGGEKFLYPKAGYPRQPWHRTLVLKYLRVTSSSGSNISRQQWQRTVHRERKKKRQYRLRKWPREVPAPQSWSPKCVEISHQRHIPKLQLCNFYLRFKPSDSWLIRLSVDNVLLINTVGLSYQGGNFDRGSLLVFKLLPTDVPHGAIYFHCHFLCILHEVYFDCASASVVQVRPRTYCCPTSCEIFLSPTWQHAGAARSTVQVHWLSSILFGKFDFVLFGWCWPRRDVLHISTLLVYHLFGERRQHW